LKLAPFEYRAPEIERGAGTAALPSRPSRRRGCWAGGCYCSVRWQALQFLPV